MAPQRKAPDASTKKRIGTPKPAVGSKQATRKLGKLSREFNASVEHLRENLDSVGACLTEFLATEAALERRRRFTGLAEAGVLHNLQSLAAALEKLPPGELPPSLAGVHRYAHLAVQQLARAFDVRPTHQLGEAVMVHENQVTDFDWSADSPGDRTFPVRATVVRCGWKCGTEVLVLPKIIRISE